MLSIKAIKTEKSLKVKISTIIVLILVLAVLALAPFLFTTYMVIFLFLLVTFIVLSESYDIVGGYLGYMNLGHIVFFGISAYIFAILISHFNLNLFLAGAAGILTAIFFALMVSYPLFKLRGGYFAIASLALAILFKHLAYNFPEWTGGDNGIFVPFKGSLYIGYWISLAIMVGCILAHWKLSNSKLGLALISIKEDELIAKQFGISPYLMKVKALIIAAFWASVMGVLYVYTMSFITPLTVFGLENALAPFIMAMLGGSGYWLGPVIGAIILMTIQEILWTKLPYFHLFIYGLVMLIIGLVIPGGVFRAIMRARSL